MMALRPGIFACQPALFVVNKEVIFNNSLPQEVVSMVPAAGWTPSALFLIALRSLSCDATFRTWFCHTANDVKYTRRHQQFAFRATGA